MDLSLHRCFTQGAWRVGKTHLLIVRDPQGRWRLSSTDIGLLAWIRRAEWWPATFSTRREALDFARVVVDMPDCPCLDDAPVLCLSRVEPGHYRGLSATGRGVEVLRTSPSSTSSWRRWRMERVSDGKVAFVPTLSVARRTLSIW